MGAWTGKPYSRRKSTPADPDILNRTQAAELLDLNPETVARLARAGKLPARKVGRAWRFSRQRLKDWIEEGGSAVGGLEEE